MHDRAALTPELTGLPHVSRAKVRQERVAVFLACAFAAELIIGGPGFWGVGEVSVRKILFSLNMAWFAGLWALSRLRLTVGELILGIGVVFFMVLWIRLVPGIRNPLQLPLAMQDGLPIATALLGVFYHAFFRTHPSAWGPFSRTIMTSLALVATFNIALWCIGMTGETGNFLAQGIALYWFTLGRLEPTPPLYVGLMSDGFFRAMWITGTLYLPALLYCIAARHKAGAALFTTALLATYTRSLWLSAAVGIALAQLLSDKANPFVDRRLLAAAVVALISAALAALIVSSAGSEEGVLSTLTTRVTSTFSDSSAEERYEQVHPLIEAWGRAPVFGGGFGASASLIRSEDAPFSYELTVLALLMKVGIVGIAVVLSVLGYLWLREVFRNTRRSRAACAGLGAIVAFLIACATNPFLINFVGISALCFMFTKLHFDRSQSVPASR